MVADCYRPTTSGVVTAMLQLARELVRRGHRVVVVTVRTPGCASQEPNVYQFASLPFSTASGFRLGLTTPGAVGQIFQKEGVEVVHTHTEFSLGWAGRWAGQALDLPLVHSAHTLYEHYRHYLFFGRALPPRLIQAYLRAFLRRYDALVCPSAKARTYYRPLVPHLSPVVIGNGISKACLAPRQRAGTERNQIRQALGIQPGERVILYVGRMGPEKRAGQLLNLLLPLLRAQKQVRALLVGNGPLLEAMTEEAQRSGVGRQLLFTGAVPWERVSEFYLAADLFATASLSEIHPMTLIEATACGLPAVVRRDEAYEELVVEGISGYLADTDEQLVERLSRLLPDTDELERLSRNALRQAEHLTIEASAARMEALYCRLV